MNAVRNYQKELDTITADIGAGKKSAPTLFLHSCCAPCSSYVLEYLRKYFRITVFYYNPNITEDEEYRRRAAEQKRLIDAYNQEAAGHCGCPEDGQAWAVYPDRGQRPCVHNAEEQIRNGSLGGGRTEGRQRGREAVPFEEEPEMRMERQGYHIEVMEGDYDPQRFYETARGLEQCPEGGERCFACYELRLRETAERARTGGYDYFTTTLSVSPLKNAAKLNEIGEQLAEEYGVSWLPSDFKKKNGYKRSVELSKEYDLYRQDYCGCIYSRRQSRQ